MSEGDAYEPVPTPWTPLRATPDRGAVDRWVFVLEALGIPAQVQLQPDAYVLLVPGRDADRAAAALAAEDREVRETASSGLAPPPDLGRSYVGVAVALALLAFFLVTGEREGPDPRGWFRSGAAIADRIVAGEAWRAVTALTLHADIMHVVGNGVAALVFLSALGRWLGGGLAVALTLLAGTAGNLIVAYTYGRGHNSVGASTATFGALGVLGGLQVIRWLRAHKAPGGRRRAMTIVAACLGLFAMLGVGERSDILAHAAGLGVGLGLGLATGALLSRPLPRAAQAALAVVSTLAVVGAWLRALG